MAEKHPSNSNAQQGIEAVVLNTLGGTLGTSLAQNQRVLIGNSRMEPDGMAVDGSVVVEVFAHVGKLKGGQRHKISTDALKLLAIRESYPEARLILAFVDNDAATSISGWKAEVLKRNGVEIAVVDLHDDDRAAIEAAQAEQQMVNPS